MGYQLAGVSPIMSRVPANPQPPKTFVFMSSGITDAASSDVYFIVLTLGSTQSAEKEKNRTKHAKLM